MAVTNNTDPIVQFVLGTEFNFPKFEVSASNKNKQNQIPRLDFLFNFNNMKEIDTIVWISL